MRRVVLEVPSRGATGEARRLNADYAQACLEDVLVKGEAPQGAFFLANSQSRVDIDPHTLSKAWITHSHALVVYQDRGISDDMKANIEYAVRLNIPVEYRNLPDATAFLLDRQAPTATQVVKCTTARQLSRWLTRAAPGEKAVYWTGNLGQDCAKNVGDSVALRMLVQRASAAGVVYLLQKNNENQNGIDYVVARAKNARLAKAEWDSEF